MKTAVVIALLAAAASAANSTAPKNPKLGYCAQGAGPLCHGPAGAGPNPTDRGQVSPAGTTVMDPSQWLCAGDVKDNTAHKFMPTGATWDPTGPNPPTGDYCTDEAVGANSACPAFCGVGAPIDFMVPYPTAAGFANDVTGGTPCTGDKCDCYGVTTQTAKGTDCAPQQTACDSFKVNTPGTANAGLTFANEIPFADKDGGLHSRCSGSVLKAVCLPMSDPTNCAAPPKASTGPGSATYANCKAWSEACNQIPTHAQWVEDYVRQVYNDGYDLSSCDRKASPPQTSGCYSKTGTSTWGTHTPGYFHGIVPNYKTTVQLDVGQLVLVRIWRTDAASIMPSSTYYPTSASPFEITGGQYAGICDSDTDKLTTRTRDITGKGYEGRKWCWKRGKIAIYMGKDGKSTDQYVVTIEGPEGNVVKGVTAYDVRPICFDSGVKQPAECSTTAGECTNMAGQVSNFKYELGQKFAVKDDKTNTISIKTVNSISQMDKSVTTTEPAPNNEYNLDKNPDIMHCFPADDTKSTGVACTNAYSQVDPTGAKTVNPHYGLEIMNIKAADAKRQSFTYTTGTIKTFTYYPDHATAQVQVGCAGATLPWALAPVSAKADGVLPICYKPAAPAPSPPAPSP